MYNPLISIITPTYNHEKFIRKCIESVLAQSYSNWEQIIIDDGSTDLTEKIIKEFRDTRIKYIKQENKGIWRLNETYNKALKHSKGEVIAILEGDDYWPDDKLANQIPSFIDSSVVLCWGKAAIVNDGDEVIGFYPNSFDKLKKLDSNESYKILFFGNFVPACTVMCRKSVLNEIDGFYQPKDIPFVDYPTWLSMGRKGKIYCIDNLIGFFRHHDKQISSTMTFEMFKSMDYSIIFFKKFNGPVEINIIDLLKYDFHQIKHNINYYRETRLMPKNKENKQNLKIDIGFVFKKLSIILLRIYYALKTNFLWIITIITNRVSNRKL